MSFTSSEKYKIRKYLGYPQVYKQANPRLESALDQVGLDTDAVADVQDILTKITQVETYLVQALSTAGLKRAEDIEWYPDQGSTASGGVVASLNQQGRKFCSQLSIIFGVPIQNNIFGGQGYTGDNWKQFSGSSNPAGGQSSFHLPLGFK